MLLGGNPRGMIGLTFSQQLDVAWAHLCMTASGGAFSNPFEVRDHLRHTFYGGDAPKKERKPSEKADPPSAPRELTAKDADLLADFTAQLRAASQANLPADE